MQKADAAYAFQPVHRKIVDPLGVEEKEDGADESVHILYLGTFISNEYKWASEIFSISDLSKISSSVTFD